MIVFCDGQLVELLRTCKIKWKTEYKRVLIGNGPFHAHGHFMFNLNEGYWFVCLCTFATWLHKKKQVYHKMKDLQHDNYKHCLDFHRVVVVGILCYLLFDVKKPSPRLLLSDIRGYLVVVNHAGGIVLLKYLIYAGIPILTFQRAMRGASGSVITACYAYAIHCHRA